MTLSTSGECSPPERLTFSRRTPHGSLSKTTPLSSMAPSSQRNGILDHQQTQISAGDTGSPLARLWRKTLPKALAADEAHIREGRFQRSMALLAGASSILAGLEVSYEHYRGSYGQKVMWTPVVLSGAMTAAGIGGFFSKWAARNLLVARTIEPRSIYDARLSDEEVAARQKSREASAA
jgi:hypothetical protein